ncbi:MAG: hypothetical protein P8Z42_06025 [Anaerolineales bacterium]|jgi:dipeptide/tripeptide permease
MVELDVPFSVFFALFALLMVVGVVCFFLFKGQQVRDGENASRFDTSDRLLTCLTILAVITLLGSIFLLFFESHLFN